MRGRGYKLLHLNVSARLLRDTVRVLLEAEMRISFFGSIRLHHLRIVMPLGAAALIGAVWDSDLGAQQGGPRLSERDMAMKMRGTFTLASVGDLIIRRPASQFADEGLQAAIKVIRDADVAVGN